MKEWYIVADSACDLQQQDIDCPEVGFNTIPFSIRVGGREYVDSEDLDIAAMLDDMESCPTASGTACPSPQDWASEFEKAAHTIAITISARLSGSMASANAAKDMTESEADGRKVYILNSRSTGPEMAMCIRHLAEWIKSGLSFEAVIAKAEKFLEDTKTTFALSSFDNLVKNGRMSKFTGFVARKLGMWGIGIASDEGTIAMKGKSRGSGKALALILSDMKERGFTGDEVAISHCFNEEMAQRLRNGILEHWQNAKVTILKARGLDSFYAERGGLIVAFH